MIDEKVKTKWLAIRQGKWYASLPRTECGTIVGDDERWVAAVIGAQAQGCILPSWETQGEI